VSPRAEISSAIVLNWLRISSVNASLSSTTTEIVWSLSPASSSIWAACCEEASLDNWKDPAFSACSVKFGASRNNTTVIASMPMVIGHFHLNIVFIR
jgi:hypothetical protein